MPDDDARQPPPRVLLLDDDRVLRDSLAALLNRDGRRAVSADSLDAAFDVLSDRPCELLVADLAAIGADPRDALGRLRREHPETVCVVLTGYGSIEEAVAATKAGAFEYLTKPVVDDEVRVVVDKALRQQALLHENRRLRRALDDTHGLGEVGGVVGRDARMRKVFELVAQAAGSRATVLLKGESGTGKSLLARAVHQLSPRRDRPFVEISCGALPENLLETELFGHMKGAFTGADRDRPGRLDAADGGTLFLDEINSASPAMQVKLLRVLQEKLYEPVGGNDPKAADVRFVLATNADLAELAARGEFRQDLYYRINVVALDLPPLRDRPGDVPLLAEHFLEQFRRELGREISGFTDAAADALARYGWPGNIRELENAVERAAVLCRRLRIDVDDLPETVRGGETTPKPIAGDGLTLTLPPAASLKDALDAAERPILLAALDRNAWNRTDAARQLGINRATLYKKMRRLGLDLPTGA